MTPERWRRMQDIFLAAAACPRAERDALLATECGSDGAMRARIERMLNVDAEPASLLDRPAPVPTPPAPSRVGTRVGPYRVLRELGRGGMGTVWLAERVDVGKRVALKLLRAGPGAPENLARFLLERRVLARLEHPNIAQLFNAGVAEDGTPYFAMEYVPGEPVDRYCDARRLSIDRRLALFESVCSAVALAHARGIVHRDLKPGNIMVAERDALEGGEQIKLLDFGIAKALEEDLAHDSVSRADFRPMTPEYAAPEQLAGGLVTPATDVYALGILLYGLLCGHAVRRVGRKAGLARPGGAPHTPPPSVMARRATSDGEEVVTPEAIAEARSVTPAELSRVLGGELDRITLTALAPAPRDRYPTAAELLADVRRYGAGRRPRGGHGWGGRLAGRPARAGLAAVGLALLLLVGFAVEGAWKRPVKGVRSGTVAVLPFDYSGPGDHRYLGDGIVSLLSSAFDATTGLRAVEPRALLGFVARNGGVAGQAASRAVARRFGAALYVTGNVVEAAGRLRVNATLRDTADRVLARVPVEGPPDSLFALLDRVAGRLLVAMPGSADASLSRSAALSTRSLPALRAYLAGEAALRAGHYAVAVNAFQRAVAADSDFALAYYRLSTAATWTGPPAVARPAAAHAVRLAARLDGLDSLRVVSWARYLRGDPARAMRGFRTIVRNRPDDLNAWFQLGETQYHWMPSLGYSAGNARQAFEHVLALEPENMGALMHLVRIAALEGQRSELDSLATRLLRLEPDGPRALEARVLRVFAGDNVAARRAMLARLNAAAASQLQSAAASLAATGVDPAGAARVARILGRLGRGPVQREFGELMAALSWTAAGRRGDAAAALARLRTLSPQLAAVARAALALAPLSDAPPTEIAAAREELARVPEAETGSILPISNFPVQPAPPVRLYLLAMLSQRLGDEAGTRRYTSRLASWRGGPTEVMFAHSCLILIRATLLRSEGRSAAALQALGPARIGPESILPELMRHPSAYEHWLRAELNREIGNDAEALRWYADVPDPKGYDIAYLPGSELRRAEIYDRRGESAEAIRHYRRFIALWRDADPRLQPRVRRARERVAKLDTSAGEPR